METCVECNCSTHLKVATPRLLSTRRSEFWYLNKTTQFFGLLPGVTSANSRSQRAEHQRGTGHGHGLGRRRAAPTAGHLLPDRVVAAPAPQGGTRAAPGGPAPAGHGAALHPPRGPSPAPPRRVSRAGPRSGLGSGTCGRAEPRRRRCGPSAATGLHGDALLPPLAWRSRSFPKLCCEQEVHLAEDSAPHRRMVAVATPPLMSREGRRLRLPVPGCLVSGPRSLFGGQKGLFPYLLDHIDDDFLLSHHGFA
ncbi:uncharacterized protein LOC134557880 [Prinia subflava]|uniref:uncharacterized protein LOC134557880 n=1 Tax=Prinia subflava TaxID=208062 RepID=UPI002FE1E5AC